MLPRSAVTRDLGRAPGLLLFGGEDNWRKLDDLWELHLHSVPTDPPLGQKREPSSTTTTTTTTTMDENLRRIDSRPHVQGGWESAETARNQRCEQLLAAGTSNDTWHAACRAEAEGRGGGRCTLRAVLERAWCLGEYQVIGSP